MLTASLQPRTFTFNDNPLQTINYGLVAQEVQQVAPELVTTDDNGFFAVRYGYLPYLTIEALKELNLKVDSLASSTSEENVGFAASFFKNVFARVTASFADAANGITDLFVKRAHTDELCVGSTCITEEQLKAVLQTISQSASAAPAAPSPPAQHPVPKTPS